MEKVLSLVILFAILSLYVLVAIIHKCANGRLKSFQLTVGFNGIKFKILLYEKHHYRMKD